MFILLYILTCWNKTEEKYNNYVNIYDDIFYKRNIALMSWRNEDRIGFNLMIIFCYIL